MDCGKVGKLIFDLRKEKGLTQKELADAMNLSDRTVSKWERGIGCPDVTLLNELSQILGVNIEKILTGDLNPNDKDGGNMKKVKFYSCPTCGNILFATGEADVSCCGRKLTALAATATPEQHQTVIEKGDGEYYVTIDHEMTKAHFISFVAFVGYDRVLIVRLYPEQGAEVRLPYMRGKKIYAYCSRHGLWEVNVDG